MLLIFSVSMQTDGRQPPATGLHYRFNLALSMNSSADSSVCATLPDRSTAVLFESAGNGEIIICRDIPGYGTRLGYEDEKVSFLQEWKRKRIIGRCKLHAR
jgi:hypothetical protein